MWRPARGAWRELLPGDSPTEFRDAEDEAAYHDSVALQEYETLDVRKFVLALQKRDPRDTKRAISKPASQQQLKLVDPWYSTGPGRE